MENDNGAQNNACFFPWLGDPASLPLTQQENPTDTSKLMCGNLNVKQWGKDSNAYVESSMS